MATVSLPGSGKNAIAHITTGADASVALTAAIKGLFTAAGKNFTYNPVTSGEAGSAGFFNIVLENEASKVSASAGTGVQAIIDIGKGSDTLTGGASTTLIVANAPPSGRHLRSSRGTEAVQRLPSRRRISGDRRTRLPGTRRSEEQDPGLVK